MQQNNSMSNLFKLLLGGLIIYLVYKIFIKGKVNVDEIPGIGDIKRKFNL